jgi:predicted nuclease of predicted toxin-antitoxin system
VGVGRAIAGCSCAGAHAIPARRERRDSLAAGRRFLLDENIDPKTATYLEKEGIHAEHVRDSLWQGADDREDILPYAREHELIVVTSDVKDFGRSTSDANAGVVLLYDDTMPAYQVAAGLITMTDAYRDRAAFGWREELDTWA